MNGNPFSKISRLAIAATVIWCMLCIFIAMRAFAFTGDDLSFLTRWENCFAENGLLGYPVFFCRHWLSTNGRMANELTPLLLSWLPRAVSDILLAAAYGALILTILRLSLPRNGFFFAKSLLIFIIIGTLPWWDSLLLYDCWLNYPIAALFGLLAVAAILSGRTGGSSAATIALALFSFIAGAMHEACGVSLAFGLIVWWFLCRPAKLSSRKGLLMIAFIAGAIFVVGSPGIWRRFGSELIGARSWWWCVLVSSFYALILAGVVIVMTLSRAGRRKLGTLLKSPWIIFAAASGAATLFCAVSGLIGRSGFFAQIFALIALFMMLPRGKRNINPVCAAICGSLLLCAVCVHMGGFAWWQRIAGGELRSAIADYRNSTDGIIYLDYTPDSVIPRWTMHKVRGVPDADDVWTLHTIAAYYGDAGKKPLIILPEAMRGLKIAGISDSVCFGETVIMRRSPATEPLHTTEGITLRRAYINGREHIVTPFVIDGDTLYRVEPRDIDPGD